MTVDGMTHTESIDIAAKPSVVYDAVRNLERMGEWSPENIGGKWIQGDGSSVGDEFEGTNKIGEFEWQTSVYVTRAEPGTAFCFCTLSPSDPMADWGYLLEANGSGTTVTETWVTHILPGIYEGSPERAAERAENVKKAMHTTLGRLKATLET